MAWCDRHSGQIPEVYVGSHCPVCGADPEFVLSDCDSDETVDITNMRPERRDGNPRRKILTRRNDGNH